MNHSGWWAAGVGLTVFVWTVYCDMKLSASKRLARRFVREARAHDSSIGARVFLISLGALGGYSAAGALAVWLAHSADDPRWALLIALPAMLAYGPFVMVTSPSQQGYRLWGKALTKAGADADLRRRITRYAGPPSAAGLAAIAITIALIFQR